MTVDAVLAGNHSRDRETVRMALWPVAEAGVVSDASVELDGPEPPVDWGAVEVELERYREGLEGS